MNIYALNTTEFLPTWLYIKQHQVTGLKYFGKTKRNPYTYKGSGKYWLRHLAQHGNKVTTLWCMLFDDLEAIQECALSFSVYHNIVDSTDWANLVPETGTQGGDFSTEASRAATSARCKGVALSDAIKQKMKDARVGRKLTDSHKQSISKSRIGLKHREESRKKLSDQRLANPSPGMTGRHHSTETRMLMSAVQKEVAKTRKPRGHKTPPKRFIFVTPTGIIIEDVTYDDLAEMFGLNSFQLRRGCAARGSYKGFERYYTPA